MSFLCVKCNKLFSRYVDLERHLNRKIPCNRYFKQFSQLSNLKTHMYKKTPCENKQEQMSLSLKIEQEKTKQEQEKTKQSKITTQQTTENIYNIKIANVEKYIN
jgi:uncharacterized Zn-finger protein